MTCAPFQRTTRVEPATAAPSRDPTRGSARPASAGAERRRARVPRPVGDLVGEAEHRHLVAGAQRRGARPGGRPSIERRRAAAVERQQEVVAFLDQHAAVGRVVALLGRATDGRRVVAGQRRAAAAKVDRARLRRAAPRTPRTRAGATPARAAAGGRRARGRSTGAAAARSQPLSQMLASDAQLSNDIERIGRQLEQPAPARATARPVPGPSTPCESPRERRRRRTTWPSESTAAARSGPAPRWITSVACAPRCRRATDRLQARQRDPAAVEREQDVALLQHAAGGPARIDGRHREPLARAAARAPPTSRGSSGRSSTPSTLSAARRAARRAQRHDRLDALALPQKHELRLLARAQQRDHAPTSRR